MKRFKPAPDYLVRLFAAPYRVNPWVIGSLRKENAIAKYRFGLQRKSERDKWRLQKEARSC